MPKRSSSAVDSTAQPRPKKIKQAAAKSDEPTGNDVPQATETPSKKRGRPRKESLAAKDIQLSSSKKRGRPAKDSLGLPKQSPSKDAAQDLETPSKKRGRPSKNAPIVESAKPSESKKRGRPPKDSSIATASKTSSPASRSVLTWGKIVLRIREIISLES